MDKNKLTEALNNCQSDFEWAKNRDIMFLIMHEDYEIIADAAFRYLEAME